MNDKRIDEILSEMEEIETELNEIDRNDEVTAEQAEKMELLGSKYDALVTELIKIRRVS